MKQKNVLVSWLGQTDLNASTGITERGAGPIANALSEKNFDDVVLLSNYPAEQSEAYSHWLKSQTGASITVNTVALERPTDHKEIYEAAWPIVSDLRARFEGQARLFFHLSPGTPAMAAIWIILAKTRIKATLIETSIQTGLRIVNVPFEMSAEFVPELIHEQDRSLAEYSDRNVEESSFQRVAFSSPEMAKLVAQAKRISKRDVPVLIEGESGTGKELLAEAVHLESPRAGQRFVPVNCGAIPNELFESEFFGHERGAFTGANAKRDGYFVQADGGTIFLDEIGELPLNSQVKILRVLQEGEVRPLGSVKTKKVNVRIIAATNRNLIEEVARGAFREDLFYRLAVLTLRVPPLRARARDISFLTRKLWDQINADSEKIGVSPKHLTSGALNALIRHSWPGNVRELQNTLLRLSVISENERISERDVEAVIFKRLPTGTDSIEEQPLGNGFSIDQLTKKLHWHYISRAMDETGNNLTQAATLLGLNNHQTLRNWIRRCEDVRDSIPGS